MSLLSVLWDLCGLPCKATAPDTFLASPYTTQSWWVPWFALHLQRSVFIWCRQELNLCYLNPERESAGVLNIGKICSSCAEAVRCVPHCSPRLRRRRNPCRPLVLSHSLVVPPAVLRAGSDCCARVHPNCSKRALPARPRFLGLWVSPAPPRNKGQRSVCLGRVGVELTRQAARAQGLRGPKGPHGSRRLAPCER